MPKRRVYIPIIMSLSVILALMGLVVRHPSYAQSGGSEKCDFLADTVTTHPNWVLDLEYSPSGDKLASAHGHRAICIWKFDDGASEPLQILTLGAIQSLHWLQGDNQLGYVTTADGPNYIVTTDLASQQIQSLRYSDNSQSPADYRPAQNELVFTEKIYDEFTGLFENLIYLYDPSSGQELRTKSIMKTDSPGGDYVWDIRWHPSLQLFAAVGHQGKIAVMSVEDNQRVLPYWSEPGEDAPYLNTIPDLPMYAVDWHPNEPDIILTAGGDETEGRLLLWQLSEEHASEPLASLEGHTGIIWVSRFSPDAQWIASADRETIRIWNYATRENVYTTEFPGVTSMAWHPDGSKLAVGSSDGRVCIYEFDNGKLSGDVPGANCLL